MEFGSEKLKQARAYENEKKLEIPKGEKPDFHLTPPIGWINDPNGFSLYQGTYHLFYQYHPYSTKWGPMHWGHSRSRDLITWEQLPCALAPDQSYDGQGCFSGTALEDGGQHILLYTGVLEQKNDKGEVVVRQTQSIAVGDGENYQKLSCNPVITADTLPAGSSPADFRDPKIWKQGGRYYAAVGSMSEDGSGQIALYAAEELTDWHFEGILDRCQNRYGKMWECPDFFPLEGRQVLIVSPQFMQAEELEFHAGNNAIYFIGDYMPEKLAFRREGALQVDYGLDFYAPQTLEAADGRRIMIAWMQSWDNYLTPEAQKWSGMMTLPRELSIRDGRLIQNPVKELAAYYGEKICKHGICLDGGSHIPGRDPAVQNQQPAPLALEGICGRQFDMILDVQVGSYERFEIDLACGNGHKTILYYEPAASVIGFDRSFSGHRHDSLCSRQAYVRAQDGKIRLRIVMDRMTVEVFVNDGEQAMSCLSYTDNAAEGICFSSKGKLVFDVDFHRLEKR